MDTREMGGLPAPLEKTRQRFERWRKTRQGRETIPDALWAAAVRVARRYGISRTAVVLRVNSSRLKEHLTSHAAVVGVEAETEGETRFVELTPFAGSGSGECLLEWEDGSGAKLCVRLRGTAMPDLAALGRGFWERQR